MELETGTVLNKIYRVVKILGKGATGNIYLVERIEDDVKFVIKELIFSRRTCPDPDGAKETCFRETEFMVKFEHPGVPKTYGTFNQDRRDYLLMDYVEGETLEKIIEKDKKPLSIYKSIRWTIEVAEILNYLHNAFQAPFVYRDLKPSNIIITPEEEIKLVDFGTAPYYNPDKNTDTFSYGSPGYGAPEQCKGPGMSTTESDIFGLGVILFQMITAYNPVSKPFTFPNMKNLNPEITDNVEEIINRALELDPLKRYVSMKEFKEDLESYIAARKAVHSAGSYKALNTLPEEEEDKSSKKIFLIISCILAGIMFIIIPPVIAGYNINPGKIFIPALITFLIILILALTVFKLKSQKILYIFIAWFGSLAFSVIIINGFIASRANAGLYECEQNLINISSALEIYAKDNEKLYPDSLDFLKNKPSGKGYMEKLPLCPLCKKEYIYSPVKSSYSFIICCGKEKSHIITGITSEEGNWPQYTPENGIKRK